MNELETGWSKSVFNYAWLWKTCSKTGADEEVYGMVFTWAEAKAALARKDSALENMTQTCKIGKRR